MPSYLNFDSTKRFRDLLINKTLKAPNGPQTFTSDNYVASGTNEFSNLDLDNVDTNRNFDLSIPQRTNIFKPDDYFIIEDINTLPRRANLSFYPYFTPQRHNIIGIMNTSEFENESELFKFAASYIRSDRSGPVLQRIERNLRTATVGRVNLIDALNGNIATATGIVKGTIPLIDLNLSITVAKTLPGKAIDFLQTVAGLTFPWSEIPGDYLTNPQNPVNFRPTPRTEVGRTIQDITGSIGSIIGIQRRPKMSRKPSDLFLEYTGEATKQSLYNLLSFSKYAPNYTTTARSQQSSGVFNFLNRIGQGVKSIIGLEAPNSIAYIGDDRSNDVKYATSDFNDRQIKSSFYLSLMFDPVQARLFQIDRNLDEGGPISGNLTWVSVSSKNKLGANNDSFNNERSRFEESLSTRYGFRDDSILGLTQDILNSLPNDGATYRTHVGNVIDQTSRVFRDGDKVMSRGSAIKYIDRFGEETGVEYCRVWTKDRPYSKSSDLMKNSPNIRRFDGSVMSNQRNLNIGPISNGNGGFDGSTNIVEGNGGFYAKKYMFSIENLAWSTSNTNGFTYSDLPYCERGNNGGRVMWFPPYDLKVSEQSNAKWEANTLLGRPEPIYTYQNTERSGQISFKVVVDHPSILNLLVREHFKDMSDEESDNYINAFFSGCHDIDFYDMIKRYTTLTLDDADLVKKYLDNNNNKEEINRYKVVTQPVVASEPVERGEQLARNTVSDEVVLLFPNDKPSRQTNELVSPTLYNVEYNSLLQIKQGSLSTLQSDLTDMLTGPNSNNADNRTDKKLIFGVEDPTGDPSTLTQIKLDDLDSQYTKLINDYTIYNGRIDEIKELLDVGNITNIRIAVFSSTSAAADNNYNLRLSIRRSDAIFKDFVDKLKKSNSSVNIPIPKPTSLTTESSEYSYEIGFRELGYDEDGVIEFSFINRGESDIAEHNLRCGDFNFKRPSLRINSPIAFGCRRAKVKLTYTFSSVIDDDDQDIDNISGLNNNTLPRTRLVEDGTKQANPVTRKPPLEMIKKIVVKSLSECFYFKKLEEDSPFVFNSLKEKLRYFHPAFHSTTPEGLNARLTFMQQCIRPGDTIPIKGVSEQADQNARNTTFGPPPICVLRIGDFYHSKIIIRDVNINYDDGVWDLNPEGIGIQPMIAQVNLQVAFIGGQGLEKPVERLQNALSSNFYANTEMYDERSINTNGKLIGVDNLEQFTREFLEGLQVEQPQPVDSSLTSSGDVITRGQTIGKLSPGNTISYRDLIENTFMLTNTYFNSYQNLYNQMTEKYGTKISSLLIRPEYRVINEFDYHSTNLLLVFGTINLFGNYRKGNDLPFILRGLKVGVTSYMENTDLSQVLEYNKDLKQNDLLIVNQLFKKYINNTIINKINDISEDKNINDFENARNGLIVSLDRVNFVTKFGSDVKKEKTDTIRVVLDPFTSNDFFNLYSEVIDVIQTNTTTMYNGLDWTPTITSMTVTDTEFLEIFSTIFRDDMISFENLLKSEIRLSENTIKSVIRRLEKSIKKHNPTNFKFKKVKSKFSKNLILFDVIDEVIETEPNMIQESLRIFGGPVINANKLNYFR